ncbi:hypothetical protein NG798_11540 [Ancylothrix sp. C2]|uniref:DUF7507 domain-containing protein n=1 Tax=Ancylothrix sp. D3o TaxID=2953691 RepID=UPI0021BA9BB0|nr:hypothetical protein [Ancylothrix sp. D3o]MCT7950424.1 hypothetical protein [Ancylothrix sp. D3o]
MTDSTTFGLNEFTGGNTYTQITLEDIVTGGVKVTVNVLPDPVTGNIGDLNGVFFHVKDESLISTLNISGGDVTGTAFGPANSVSKIDLPKGGGTIAIDPQSFDAGVAIGTSGIGKDDIRSTSFTISSRSKELTLADFINANTGGSDFGVRLTSVGTEGGKREDSSKLSGEVTQSFTANPQINIDKVTGNGTTKGDGLTILEGENVTWTYTVTNTGNVELSNISLNDDQIGAISNLVSGDTDKDNKLDTNETWVYNATGTATEGDYSNIGLVSGSYNGTTVTDSDPSSYFGANPEINIDKVTVYKDIEGDGLNIKSGEAIDWKYTVTNTGNVGLSNVSVSDDKVGSISTFVGGDTDGDSILDTTETWVYKASGTATVGDYKNTGTVSGSVTDDLGNTKTVTDSDDSSYFGENPAINIDKVTVYKGEEGDGLNIKSGEDISWKYTVTNTGNVGLSNVSVTDDKEGAITNFVEGDADGDKILDTNETWVYTAAGTAAKDDYSNTGTVKGSTTDSAGNTQTVTDSDDSSYFGENPAININKVTVYKGQEKDGLAVLKGDTIDWKYTVTNTGNVGLSNVSVTDDKEGAITNFVGGDTDNDKILDTTETWVYTATGKAISGPYSNTGTVTGSNNGTTVTDTDDSSYTGCAGVRTPGYWCANREIWNGDASDDYNVTRKPNAPTGDILLQPYTNSAQPGKVLDPVDPVTGQYSVGLLIGDLNKDGVTNNGERTIFYNLDEAEKTMSRAQSQLAAQLAGKPTIIDTRYYVASNLTAAWLNYLSGNPVDAQSINNGVQWLQLLTPDENNDGKGDGYTAGDGYLWLMGDRELNRLSPPVSETHSAWTTGITNPLVPSGESIAATLQDYNTTGGGISVCAPV